MNTKRLNVIDVAKGIGIILVVFAHVNYTPSLLTIIYSFHMPLFFLISGMLYQKDKFSDFWSFLKRRFKRLMIPYVIYELLSMICLWISERIYADLQMFDVSFNDYLEYIRQIFISSWSGVHVNQPLWFLPCLFLVEIMYFFLAKTHLFFRIPVCVVLVSFGWILESGILPFDNYLLPWSLDSAFFALGFYAIGNLSAGQVKNMIDKIERHRYKTVICVFLMILLFLILVPIAFMNGKITLGSKVLNNGAFIYLTGIIGTILVLAMSILWKNNKFLVFCGRNSFRIMAIHYIVRNYIVKPVYVMINGEMYDRKLIQETIIPFIFVFVFSAIYAFLYNRISNYFMKKNHRLEG